jgi:hypothetical protein
MKHRSKRTGEADPFTVNDYNRKNEKACRIDGARLLAHILRRRGRG